MGKCRGSPMRVILSFRGHWAISKDIFGHHSKRPSGLRTGHTEDNPHSKGRSGPNCQQCRVEKPWGSHSGNQWAQVLFGKMQPCVSTMCRELPKHSGGCTVRLCTLLLALSPRPGCNVFPAGSLSCLLSAPMAAGLISLMPQLPAVGQGAGAGSTAALLTVLLGEVGEAPAGHGRSSQLGWKGDRFNLGSDWSTNQFRDAPSLIWDF